MKNREEKNRKEEKRKRPLTPRKALSKQGTTRLPAARHGLPHALRTDVRRAAVNPRRAVPVRRVALPELNFYSRLARPQHHLDGCLVSRRARVEEELGLPVRVNVAVVAER